MLILSLCVRNGYPAESPKNAGTTVPTSALSKELLSYLALPETEINIGRGALLICKEEHSALDIDKQTELLNALNRGNVRYSPPSVNTRTGEVTRLFETLIPILPSVGIMIEF